MLIDAAGGPEVDMAMYTFDSREWKSGLVHAGVLGANVRLLVDQRTTTAGKTRDQLELIRAPLHPEAREQVRKLEGHSLRPGCQAIGRS